MRGALVIGIDHYSNAELEGCINDAKQISSVLQNHANGDPNFECKTIVSESSGSRLIERHLLKREIEELFSRNQDMALLYFAGHGTENNLDGYIVTQDARQYDEGVSVSDILQMANRSKAKERIIIFDCCHSGRMGNAPQVNNHATLAEGVTILTACRSDQKAYEASGSGVFTSLLLDALNGGAADVLGKVTVAGIYSYVDQALGFFNQRPLYKSHVSTLATLRKCDPAIDVRILRAIPEYFKNANDTLQLDPAYEETVAQHDPAKVAVFKNLQKLRGAGLLEPIDEVHMYDAAMNKKACRLTSQGKYYWFLAKERRI